MKKLSPLEVDVLTQMALRAPFSLDELKKAYFLTGYSFDKTLKAIEYSCSRAVSLTDAIEAMKKDVDTYKEACLPLIKYLCENHHPHVTVIVTPVGAELLEGIKSTGEVTDFIQD